MQRERNLFPGVVAFDNLYRAFVAASHGKRERPEVREFEYHLESRLWEIRDELVSGAYAWGPFHRFWVRDPKRREIRAAPFRDRVVHHALFNVLDPIFRRGFIADSYACIPGRGTHRAVRRYRAFVRARAGRGYRVQGDVKGYFASVDHAMLLERLRCRIGDQRLLTLLYVDGRARVRRRSVRRLWRRLPALQRRVAAREIDSEMARASVASWFGLAKHADAFRLSKRIFTQRDVDNVGKRLLVQSLGRTAWHSAARPREGRPNAAGDARKAARLRAST